MEFEEPYQSDDWNRRITRARRTRKAELDAFKTDIGKILDGASERLSTSSRLEDVETYLAACLVFIKHSRDARSIRDMLIHIGRVLGHDRRTIRLEDSNESYEALLAEIRTSVRTIDATSPTTPPSKSTLGD